MRIEIGSESDERQAALKVAVRDFRLPNLAIEPFVQGWQEALRRYGKAFAKEDVVKMQALAESWRVKYYDHLGEPAYLKCAEDLTAIIGEGD